MRTRRRNNGGFIAIGLVGAIVIAMTVAAFFLSGIERTALTVWALSFLLLSEAVVCTGLICLRRPSTGSVFVWSGAVSAMWLYFAVTLVTVLIVVLFVRKFFTEHLNWFILMQLGIVALFAIRMVMILAFGRRGGAEDARIVEARRFMDGCEQRVHALLSDGGNAKHAKLLNSLYEDIKYGDKIGASSVDSGLDGKISELEAALRGGGTEEDRDAAVAAVAGELSTLISRRKAEVGQAKRGGF
jgi:hypothetical protein